MTKFLSPGVGVFFASLAVFGMATEVHAQNSQTWLTTGADKNWNTTSNNWDAGVPWIQNNNAIFGTTAQTITATVPITFNDIVFNVGGYQIAAGAGSLSLANDLSSTITVTNAGDVATISAALGNSANGASSLVKTGAGTLTLTAVNTYTGATNVLEGVLNLYLPSTLLGFPLATSSITVADGAQLKLTDTAYVTAPTLNITGSGINGTGALLLDGTAKTSRYGSAGGAVNVVGSATIGATGSITSIIGELSGGGAGSVITKVGTGTLQLGNNIANSYTGTLRVSEGILMANKGGPNQLAITGDLVVDSGAAYAGSNNSGLISASSNLTNNGTFILNNRGNNTVGETFNSISGSGTIRAAYLASGGVGTLTVSSTTTNSTYSGNLVADTGTLNLVKSGAGTTLRLNGSSNTYTGTTTVNAGTLLINGEHTGGGSYSIAAAGTFGGNGNISASSFTTSAGSKLTPGDGGAGTLTMSLSGGMNIAASSNNTGAYMFDLGTVGTSDKIVLALGTLNVGVLDFSDFTFNALSGFGAGGQYVLFETNSAILGSIGVATGTINGQSATLAFSGNNVVLNVAAIPEPGTVAMFMMGAFGLVLFARRSR